MLFKANNNYIIKNNLIETITGNVTNYIREDLHFIQNNGEIQIIGK